MKIAIVGSPETVVYRQNLAELLRDRSFADSELVHVRKGYDASRPLWRSNFILAVTAKGHAQDLSAVTLDLSRISARHRNVMALYTNPTASVNRSNSYIGMVSLDLSDTNLRVTNRAFLQLLEQLSAFQRKIAG